MKIDTARHSFIVSYFVDEKTTGIGTAQAFEFQSGQLFIQSLEHDNAGKNKARWIPALCCKCKKILSVTPIHELVERYKVTIDDLKVIENFAWKYEEAKKVRIPYKAACSMIYMSCMLNRRSSIQNEVTIKDQLSHV